MSTESEYAVRESRAMQTEAGDAEKLLLFHYKTSKPLNLNKHIELLFILFQIYSCTIQLHSTLVIVSFGQILILAT